MTTVNHEVNEMIAQEMRHAATSNEVAAPYWHDHNPWKDDVVYISPAEADGLLQEVYMDDTYWMEVFLRHDGIIDAYLLPQPGGRFSFGIRYGKDGPEYLSPYCRDETAQKIYDRRKGEKA